MKFLKIIFVLLCIVVFNAAYASSPASDANDNPYDAQIRNTVECLIRGTKTSYRLYQLVRDRAVLEYMLDSVTPSDRYIEVGSAENRSHSIIIGDLHGDFYSLGIILSNYGERVADGSLSLIFLGDYIDRGPHSFEVLFAVLALRHVFPNQIFMLSGNHEGKECFFNINYQNLCRGIDARTGCVTTSMYELKISNPWKYFDKNESPIPGGDTAKFIEKLLGMFDSLPVCLKLNGNILCVHGVPPIPYPFWQKRNPLKTKAGISIAKEDLKWCAIKSVFNPDYIEARIDAKKTTQPEEHRDKFKEKWMKDLPSILAQIMQWSDPVSGVSIAGPWHLAVSPRAYSYSYNVPIDLIESILGSNKLEFLVRGHSHNSSVNAYGNKIYNIISSLALNENATVLEINPDAKSEKSEKSAKSAKSAINVISIKDLIPKESVFVYITLNLGAEAVKSEQEWLSMPIS